MSPETAGRVSVTDELMTDKGEVRLSAIAKYLLLSNGPLATTGCDHGALVSTRGESAVGTCEPAFSCPLMVSQLLIHVSLQLEAGVSV